MTPLKWKELTNIALPVILVGAVFSYFVFHSSPIMQVVTVVPFVLCALGIFLLNIKYWRCSYCEKPLPSHWEYTAELKFCPYCRRKLQ